MWWSLISSILPFPSALNFTTIIKSIENNNKFWIIYQIEIKLYILKNRNKNEKISKIEWLYKTCMLEAVKINK